MTRPIAIITGASSGLGREFARQLDKDPDIEELWLCARREERLNELAEELQTPSRVFAGSVTDPEWLGLLRAALATEDVNVNILINSAGYGKANPVTSIPEDVNADMVAVNSEALTRLCSICLPHMTAGGRILNIASVAGFLPQPHFAVYAATKAYVISYSRALNYELRKRDITVTAVCPNPMETEFFAVAGSKRNPLKRLGVEPVSGVAAKALRRSARGKDMSLYSLSAHLIKLISRIFPHRLILTVEGWLGFFKSAGSGS